MSVEENKAIARRLVEGWHNVDILDEVIAADFVGHYDVRGLEAYKQACSTMRASFSDWRIVAEDIIAEEDRVVIRWSVTATHTGEWGGIAPTGKQVTWAGMDAFRIADGKIAEGWQYWTPLWLFHQLGFSQLWDRLVKQAQGKQE